MNCAHANLAIQSSLDGPLPQEMRLALDAHLESCAACRREQDAQRRLTGLGSRWASRAVEASDPGEDFTLRVLSHLETPPAPPRLRVWLPLTAALLLLGALTLVPGGDKLSPSMTAQSLAGLPLWLRANLADLPADAHTVFQATQAILMPAWTTALGLGVFLLNVGFCVHARQRSTS